MRSNCVVINLASALEKLVITDLVLTGMFLLSSLLLLLGTLRVS